MSLYIHQLQTEAKASEEQEQARQAAQIEINQAAEATAARNRMVPLDVRLGRLLDTIPIEVQREGLSLTVLRTMLRGRRGGGCQSGELGLALRRLGWTRTRCWRGGAAGGFSALWHPPSAASPTKPSWILKSV